MSPKCLTARELMLLLPTLAAALWSVRHLPIFAVVATPVLAGFLEAWLRPSGVRLLDSQNRELRRSSALLNLFLIVAISGFAALHAWRVIQQQPAAEARQFPAAVVSFLANNHAPQPLMNHYNWGGYFIWKLYPDYRVYIDGRADVYGDDFMSQFASAYYLSDDWRKPMTQWDISSVVLPPDAPLITALRSNPDWKQSYADSQAVVLKRILREH